MTAADGIKLHGWFLWPKEWAHDAIATKPTIIFFQENAGNISWRLPFLRTLARYLDCSILAPRHSCSASAACHSLMQSAGHLLQCCLQPFLIQGASAASCLSSCTDGPVGPA